jgi:CheY-like chemotaxis protein
MPSVLICTPAGLRELTETVLWRDNVERTQTKHADHALALAANHHYDLVVVDHAAQGAVGLVRSLRADPASRGSSIAVVMDRTEFDPYDLEIIDAGANAILRPPVDALWDERLAGLMRVPPRRAGRFPVELKVEVMAGVSGVLGGAALNLSEHGMLLEADSPLRLGMDLDFWIYLRDDVTPLRGCGQVIRQDGPKVGGVRFFALESDGLARLRRFVQS